MMKKPAFSVLNHDFHSPYILGCGERYGSIPLAYIKEMARDTVPYP